MATDHSPAPGTTARPRSRANCVFAGILLLACGPVSAAADLGSEVAVPEHLSDGDEYIMATRQLVTAHGRLLFASKWTTQTAAADHNPPARAPRSPIPDRHSFFRVIRTAYPGPMQMPVRAATTCRAPAAPAIASQMCSCSDSVSISPLSVPPTDNPPGARSTNDKIRFRCKPLPTNATPSACSGPGTSRFSQGR